jgi:hypothetical protein
MTPHQEHNLRQSLKIKALPFMSLVEQFAKAKGLPFWTVKERYEAIKKYQICN